MSRLFSPERFPLASRIAAGVLLFLILTAVYFGRFNVLLPVVGITAAAAAVWLAAGFAERRFPRTGRFVTLALPLIAYPVLYKPVHALMTAANPGVIDAALLQTDKTLFGTNPVFALHSISSPPLTDFAYLSYFSYYFGMPGLIILMYLKNRGTAFDKVLSVMTLGWYGALITYLLFPALGPQRYLAGALPELHGWLPTSAWIQDFLTANLTPVVRDCVPSMHTAVTILTLTYAYSYHRGFFYLYLVPGLGLIFATMYLQQHYVIDVLLGLLTAGIIYLSMEYVYSRTGSGRPVSAIVHE